ncbi:MAG: NADH-quinone oxidoreductase subunit J, partial [Anaerolineae bacterium]|nr:NADH-quinone oxidoreductase subunit J [Anaerolineae bacterium]
MTEVSLFILIGAIAVVAAVLMLLSENAVHSALFLIVVMGCIAFLFLMLNAPFLAMVQVTVYAGAIMVLFLFVIMLLGAEKLGGSTPFRWMTPGAMVLALLFLVVVGLGLGAGPVTGFTPPLAAPQVRIADFVRDSGTVNLRINGEVVEEGLQFGDTVGYLSFPAGDYEIALVEPDTENVLLNQTVTLEQGFLGTAVAYSADQQPTLSLVADDLTATDERSGRVMIFNAYDEVPAVSLVDFGSDFSADDTQVLVSDIALGSESQAVEFAEDTDLRSWALVEAGNENHVLARLNDEEAFGFKRGVSTLLILGVDRLFDGSTRALAAPLSMPAAPTFGSPADVGKLLFSRYMLPMQAVAILLLVAMVGAIVLTHKPRPSAALARAQLGRRRVSRPLTSVIAAQVGHEVSGPGSGA